MTERDPRTQNDKEPLSLQTRRRPEIPTAIRFLVAIVLFFGGFVVLAVAFDIVGYEAWVFSAGMLMITAGLAFAIHA